MAVLGRGIWFGDLEVFALETVGGFFSLAQRVAECAGRTSYPCMTFLGPAHHVIADYGEK